MTGASRESAEGAVPAGARLVVVFVCDSLRRDALSCYGYHRRTTPNIDRLARDAVLLDDTFSECTWTRPAAASLLTSLYPPAHGVVLLYDGLPDSLRTLPKVLKGLGFRTIGISAMPNVSSLFGFGNGFDVFVDMYKDPEVIARRGTDVEPQWYRRVGESSGLTRPKALDINALVRQLAGQDGPDAPLFLFLWSVDTHQPYEPLAADRVFLSPSPGRLRRAGSREIREAKSASQLRELRDLYDCEVRGNDRALGELIDWVRNVGLYDSALIVLLSDHGEAFGEHGVNGHGGFPYDEKMRIPMIVKMPRQELAGRRVRGLCQLVDVAPTILELLGARRPAHWQGRSLLPLMRGDDEGRDAVYCHFKMHDDSPEIRGVRTKSYKLVRRLRPRAARGGPRRLWRAVRDVATGRRYRYEQFLKVGGRRAEMANMPLAGTLLPRIRMARRLESWSERCRALRKRLRLPPDQRVPLAGDSRLVGQLRDLGYM